MVTCRPLCSSSSSVTCTQLAKGNPHRQDTGIYWRNVENRHHLLETTSIVPINVMHHRHDTGYFNMSSVFPQRGGRLAVVRPLQGFLELVGALDAGLQGRAADRPAPGPGLIVGTLCLGGKPGHVLKSLFLSSPTFQSHTVGLHPCPAHSSVQSRF